MEIKDFKNQVEKELEKHCLLVDLTYARMFPDDDEYINDYSCVVKTKVGTFIASFNVNVKETAITKVLTQCNFSEIYLLCKTLNKVVDNYYGDF